MRIAVIDLGTNTFHLLVVDSQPNGTFKELYRKRVFIKLAEDGIKTIGPLPFKRALDALHTFKEILDNLQVHFTKAFGTAALRTASNGSEFILQVFEDTGIEIQLISGNREAQLIHKGVTQAVPLNSKTGLIMDIGGGSVEFILANQTGLLWAQSFPIGVAVLFNRFHKNDPISNQEINTLFHFLEEELSPLFKQLEKHPASLLIGASGTFDVIEKVLSQQKESSIHAIVSAKKFQPFYKDLIYTSLEKRYAMDSIPDSRAEMIIVALVLIHFILKKSSIQTISISAYAMKEGMLQELIENPNF